MAQGLIAGIIEKSQPEAVTRQDERRGVAVAFAGGEDLHADDFSRAIDRHRISDELMLAAHLIDDNDPDALPVASALQTQNRLRRMRGRDRTSIWRSCSGERLNLVA